MINVEKLAVEAGETVTFDNIVAVSDGSLKAGADVANATVTASVVKEGKAKKVIVYRYKRKSGYHKKNGHRQAYTCLLYTSNHNAGVLIGKGYTMDEAMNEVKQVVEGVYSVSYTHLDVYKRQQLPILAWKK